MDHQPLTRDPGACGWTRQQPECLCHGLLDFPGLEALLCDLAQCLPGNRGGGVCANAATALTACRHAAHDAAAMHHAGSAQLCLEAPAGQQWGLYARDQLTSVTAWLENGSAMERELAGAIHEQLHMVSAFRDFYMLGRH